MTNLKEWIKKCEGYKPKPYLDTLGKLSIGYGRNLKDNGISLEEANFMFENDLARCQKELYPYSWYLHQPLHIQYALVNMCFNLGLTKLLGFKKMIQALEEKNYTKAAMEALDSKWATQVKGRAKQVALMMREGF